MSWHYSVVLVEECLEAGYLTRKSCARLKESRMLSRSCFDDKRTGRSLPSQSGTTSKPSRDFLSVGSLMWSLRGSLANLLVRQENKKEKTTTETSGPILRELSGRYDPELSCWRTSPDCFGHTEELSSATFPPWGMTVGGELYPLKMPEQLTSERGGGVWPTPRSSNPSGSRPNGKGGKVLAEEVQIKEGIRKRGRRTWTTPTVQDGENNGGESQFRRNTLPLNAQAGGSLAPEWVEWLMGWPCGWTSLDPLPAGELERWQKQVEEGTYWDVDPANSGEVPRLTDIKLHRPARLRATGNGQVPAQLALAVRCLEEAR